MVTNLQQIFKLQKEKGAHDIFPVVSIFSVGFDRLSPQILTNPRPEVLEGHIPDFCRAARKRENVPMVVC